ncbi:hypothetical protein [Micromonospora schwarzwaldensis]|uniref:hypothetical protein n=1 Tax=Micromonospora sp. DSM 45708 TaxID=3111767 RepID=UPI0031DC42E0
MSDRVSGGDRALISQLLDVAELDPADLDAIPRGQLHRSLRRLIDETGDPTAEFLWFGNQSDNPGARRRWAAPDTGSDGGTA